MNRAPNREFGRGERIGAELMRALTAILRDGVKDPRLGQITLQEIRVTRDLAHAKVYFTCFPLDEDGATRQRLLNGPLAGFLRHALSKTERLRSVPQLHFVHDESIQHGERLSALIDGTVAAARAAETLPAEWPRDE